MNDPQRGFVWSTAQVQEQVNESKDNKKLPDGFDKNGDEVLTERFNPNNVELNKRRF